MSKVYIETKRMILRDIQSGDEQNLLELDSDHEVMRYLTNGLPHTRVEIRQALIRMVEMRARHSGKFGYWAAIEKSTSKFMGWFHFRPSLKDPTKTTIIELGYRLKKEFWGQGYATEGSMALLDKGFNQLGVEKVFATTMKKNIASQRVMEKVGMKFDKEFRDDSFPESNELDVQFSITKLHVLE